MGGESRRCDRARGKNANDVDGALRRALASADTSNPGAIADGLNTATKNLFSDLVSVGPLIATILVGLRNQLVTIMVDPERSNSWKQAQIAGARQAAQAALDDLKATAVSTGARIQKQLDAVTTQPASGDQSANEMQIAQAWSVAQPLLSGVITGDGIQTLVNANIPGMTVALRRYLPVTLRAANSALPPQHIAKVLEAAMAQLDQATAPAQSNALQLARQLQARLSGGLNQLASAFAMASGEVQGVMNPVAILPGFDGLPIDVTQQPANQ